MALVHAGRSVVLVGIGLAGSVALQNGKLAEIQEILRDKGVDGVQSSAKGSPNDRLLDELIRLKMDMQRIGSQSVVTVLQADRSGGVLSALVVPAAAVGAVGYCYMWWKGISFSSLMYVTRRNMANAVASMTKHLEQVQSSLAATKKHLTQRIQRVDDKLELQKEISGQIKDEVTGARLKISMIGSDMDKLKNIVVGLDEKMDSIETKQNYSCVAVDYLCRYIEGSKEKTPERLLFQQGLQRTVRRFADDSLPGLGIGQLLALESANPSRGMALRSSTVINSARLIL